MLVTIKNKTSGKTKDIDAGKWSELSTRTRAWEKIGEVHFELESPKAKKLKFRPADTGEIVAGDVPEYLGTHQGE